MRSVETIGRPRVARLLAGAWRRTVTLVVAGGGYGKTTAVRELAAGTGARWLSLAAADRDVEVLSGHIIAGGAEMSAPAPPIGASDRRVLAETQAAAICATFDPRPDPLLLVLDDVDQLSDADSGTALLSALCLQAPPQLHLVLCGRRVPTLRLGILRGRGQVLDVAASDLAFTHEEVRRFLGARLGSLDEGLAEQCWELTGGWAAALQLVADGLTRVGADAWQPTLRQLARQQGGVWREFTSELIEGEPAGAQAILGALVVLGAADAALLDALGFDAAQEQLDSLSRRGLIVATGEHGVQTLSPVLAEITAERLAPVDPDGLVRRATQWLEQAGRLDEALSCAVRAPEPEALAFLRRSGRALIRDGFASRVTAALHERRRPDDPELEMIRAEALVAAGDWDSATEIFDQLERRAGGGRLLPPAAWRYGALLYLRGETGRARRMLTAAVNEAGLAADDALVSAWLSAALWSRGESADGEHYAALALRQAEASGDAAARAAAHTAMAMSVSSRGERELIEHHNRLALAAAMRAGDSVQIARVHVNVCSKALEDGDYPRAIAEADHALITGAGHKAFSAIALSNKAEALIHTGGLDEARALLVQAIELLSDLGSLMAAAPLTLLGELDAERGDLARARMSFEHALRLGERAGDVHDVVRARHALARILAEDDPDLARPLARRAVEHATSLERAAALCAWAWVELCGGDDALASRLAREAQVEARRTDDRPALAHGLALEAAAAQPPDEAGLAAAEALWREIEDPIALIRAGLSLAACRGDASRVAALSDELTRRGVRPDLGVAGMLLARRVQAPELAITTLGRFTVLRAGQPIPLAAWGSRKARDLLKLLVCRSTHSLTRDAAAEALWPGEGPKVVSNRLSVALSTLRSALDPDRKHARDHFIAGDDRSIALRTDHVALDLTRFLDAAQEGAALTARGDAASAEATLRLAESLYTGDFLAEDLYEDWTVDRREQARAAAQEMFRLLARTAAVRGDDEDATRHLRRLLERDPYDADAWIALVGAQLRLRRYGEARRQHGLYAQRMAELDLAPVPLSQAIDSRP